MIVRQTPDAFQLITQPDHAALAGAIMQHSAALADHPRRASIFLAVAEHDNGWNEPDAAPSINPASGVPFDFISAPSAVRQGVWPRGVARLANDPWAAALVAQHAIVIFNRYRGDPAWAQFFTEMESLRREMVQASELPLPELLADYWFLGLGDLISLTFCNGWTDVQEFDPWSVRLSSSQVLVSPDPFDGSTIPIAIEAQEIPKRRYRDEAELREARATSHVTTLRGVISATTAR
ncbi:MAG TPA: DUF3891 family protein [Vicinamibacterales bacterium]